MSFRIYQALYHGKFSKLIKHFAIGNSTPSLYNHSALLQNFRRKSSIAPQAVNHQLQRKERTSPSVVGIPNYLQNVYWWAYLHPNALQVFERQWLVDAILWGNYRRLRDATLDELQCREDDDDDSSSCHSMIQGRTLQVACVYGNFTKLLAQCMAPDASLDVVDVAPIQIENLQHKLQQQDNHDSVSSNKSINLSCNNATHLEFDDSTFRQVVLFFLLHEMPMDVRRKTIQEATRVVQPGGKIVIVDYHQPTSYWHPHRYLMPFVFRALEPFAMDLWDTEICDWLPTNIKATASIKKDLYFGGLYQKVVVMKK